jgi:hypothetical protein
MQQDIPESLWNDLQIIFNHLNMIPKLKVSNKHIF